VIRHIGLSCLWLIASLVTTPIAWGVVGTVNSIFSATYPPETIGQFVASVIIITLHAIAAVVFLAPAYGAILLLWPVLAQSMPSAERRFHGLLVAVILLAIPGAFIVASSRAESAGYIRWDVFAEWFTMALVAGVIGLVSPRIAIAQLRPGAFKTPCRLTSQ